MDRILAELDEEKKELERERGRDESERVRHFELEKLKILLTAEATSLGSTACSSEPTLLKINLKGLEFDPKCIDISLFFMISERQNSTEKVNEYQWIFQFISLLPNEVGEKIMKQSEE